MLIIFSVLVFNTGCPLKDDRPLIEDEETFYDLPFDQQSSLIGSDPRLDRTISEFTDEIASAPTSRAYTGRGSAYLLKGNYELAMSDYNSAIKLDPGNLSAYYNRGLLRSQVLDYELAILDFTSTIDADPQHAHAYANRGNCYLALKQYDLGMADLRKVIELDPEEHIAMHSLGIALFENPNHVDADVEAAFELLTRACELTGYSNEGYVDTLRYYKEFNSVRKDQDN